MSDYQNNCHADLVETALNLQWEKMKEQLATKLKRIRDKSTSKKVIEEIDASMSKMDDYGGIDKSWLSGLIWDFMMDEFLGHYSAETNVLMTNEDIWSCDEEN